MAVLEDLSDYGKMQAGQLIKSEDWNNLVAGVEKNDQTLKDLIENAVSKVSENLETLQGQLKQLQETFATFQGQVTPLMGEYYRVTLETARDRYVIGEQAEILAKVTDLHGKPLNLTQQTRPWLDFIATWGRLKPAAGFEFRAGVAERSLSVRTNLQGEARLLLSADHTEGLTDEDEAEAEAALKTILPATQKNMAESILETNTPMEAKTKGVFGIITAEYCRTDAKRFRQYVDTFYVKNATVVHAKDAFIFVQNWNFYRATIMAVVKKDSDPRTPDQGRGLSSIQTVFCNWLMPWIHLDFMAEIKTSVEEARDRFKGKIYGNYADSLRRLKMEALEIVQDKGLLGKQRAYKAMNLALDEVMLESPPAFMEPLILLMQNTMNFQQAMAIPQIRAVGTLESEAGLVMFSDAAVHTAQEVDRVRSQSDALDDKITEAEKRFGDKITEAEQGFSNKVDNAMAGVKGEVSQAEKRFGKQLDEFKATINDQVNLQFNANLATFRGEIAQVQQRIDQVQKNFTDLSSQQKTFQGNLLTVQNDVGFLKGSLDKMDKAVLAEGGEFARMKAEFGTLKSQLNEFKVEGLEPSNLKGGMLELKNLATRVALLEGR